MSGDGAVTRPAFRTGPGQGLDLVTCWVTSPALRGLLEAAGGTWPRGDLRDVLDGLAEFSAVWDRRSGRSRLVFKAGDESRTDARATRTYGAARELGLLDPGLPTLTEPDHLLILGGLATGVEPRMRYAADLLSSGQVRAASIAALGSHRTLDDRERPAATRAPDRPTPPTPTGTTPSGHTWARAGPS
jgi:hypothetical protein